MISKRHRGIAGRDILLLRRFGNRRKLDFGMLWWRRRSDEAKFSRLAVSVSAKQVPKAVTRNHLRRIVQGSLFSLTARLHPPHDIFIDVRSPVLPKQNAIREEVEFSIRTVARS